MPVYRIEKNLEGVTTDDEPYAVVEVTQNTDDVETLETLSTWASEEDAQTEVDRLTEAAVSDSEEFQQGKPSKGTPADKRLKENKKKSALEQAMEFTRRRGTPMTPDELSTLQRQVTEAETITAATKAAPAAPVTAGWTGTICVEGITSGDQREFAKGALTWADPPIPLRWKKEDAHGGQNDVTVAVGTITNIQRKGQNIVGDGVFDLGSADGREAHRRVGEGFLKGISIDADDITDADIEFVWPENDTAADEDDMLAMLFASPDKILFHAGRIRAATLVDIPAFVEAYVSLTASVEVPEDLEPAGVLDERVRQETQGHTLTAAGVVPLAKADAPPRAWFDNPNLSVPMNIQVTDDGRVYGHAAHWSECHIGHPDMCITAPYEDSHPYFATGEVVCADGTRVQVGQITLGTGHAPLPYNAQRAAEHYDNTGSCVADIAIGNDEHGIWVAGAIRPGTDPARVRELRASGKVSGDWRRIAGSLRMVGLLAVNVAGFQTPQVRSRVASGQQMALVAAGQPKLGGTTVDIEAAAMRFLMNRMAAKVRGSKPEE